MNNERTIEQLTAAEHEAFERLWYYRHVSVARPPGVGAESEARISKQYSGVSETEELRRTGQLGRMNDYEQGYLEGKLSALRWVLGDEWDFLDS